MIRRRGVGLPELLVALALSGVVMAAATRALALHLQLQRTRETQARADEIAHDVLAVLRAEAGRALGAPLVLGDTALDLASQRILATPCERAALRLVVSAADPWWSPPRAGDSVALLDTLTRSEWRTTVAAVGSLRRSVACPLGGTRLTLSDTPPATVPALTVPVRVWRRVRYTIYRSSDGYWWFGERSCASACGSAQPIAGPLRSASQHGLRLLPVLNGTGRPTAIDVEVRAEFHSHSSVRQARLTIASSP